MSDQRLWHPPDFSDSHGGPAHAIRARLRALYPEALYGDLALRIGPYWIEKLQTIQSSKAPHLRSKDSHYDTADPLSRVFQRAVVIAYADSVYQNGSASLEVLDDFLSTRFPAVGGLHLLPACIMAEDRFNDGGFSQIRRDQILPRFGSNERFESLMEKYISMTDLVLNHVDVDNPMFGRYLGGDDVAGRCFYVFSSEQYRSRKAQGDFEAIFRPRPFPLFTLFRRAPQGEAADLTHGQRLAWMNRHFHDQGLSKLPEILIDLLTIFDKIKNDQMLLAEDMDRVMGFRHYLASRLQSGPEMLFTLSRTQETRHPPYVFVEAIETMDDLMASVLPVMGLDGDRAGDYAALFRDRETALFGESIRALTTFSHVQVDLNTATFEGLKLLIDDFSWYLGMDLNMLRLDAANFAFKKWGTACFGLVEVKRLMEILYLSMEAVAPRMVPNLEVNAPLSAVLAQMADKASPPPMMYDFHLASMLPVVFNQEDARPLEKIGPLVGGFDIPRTSIRFSLDESHDGKSVNGSGGAALLLTYAQRRALIAVVKANGGQVKYKSTPRGRMDPAEFAIICVESGLDKNLAAAALFDSGSPFRLQPGIDSPKALAQALGVVPDRLQSDPALDFLTSKLLQGREPYELCVSTRDALVRVDNPVLELRRYLAFKTLGFALMGRHVKAVYFNDLMGLPNDPDLVRRTGELRNIKRTRSERSRLEALIDDPARCEYWIARLMNNTIALVDHDPAFSPRGNEAQVTVAPAAPAVAWVKNTCHGHFSLVVVNTSKAAVTVDVVAPWVDLGVPLWENLSGMPVEVDGFSVGRQLPLEPFGRLWLTPQPVRVPQGRLVPVGTAEEMVQKLSR
ncbi:MAG: hypothetical protein JEZ11_26295 [Desulfobacterales bacterium]|nr:hypothetical protein [Desulfobacterales bacterium]